MDGNMTKLEKLIYDMCNNCIVVLSEYIFLN